ncbi:MAG TPA: hypothetical protein VH040_01735 [Usitatibacter sp.]|jgi:hypothetical protein|nr:hypothetical protein [Usitatibacter sp.]
MMGARLGSLRAHVPFILLLAALAPLALHFGWHAGITTVGDDSVSYLTLAHWFAGDSSDPHLAKWTWWQAHFPPLFPMLLAVTGAWHHLGWAHLLVAGLGIAAMALFYAYANVRLQSRLGAFAVAGLFALAPVEWVHTLGILSEPLFLVLSLAALLWHQTRLAGRKATDPEWLLFGVLVALTCLTRLVGVALIAALVAQALCGRLARRKGPGLRELALAVAPTILLLGAWVWLRPMEGGDKYQGIVASSLSNWIDHPGTMLGIAVRSVDDAWISAFTVDPEVPLGMRIVFIGTGLAAVCGAVLAALANRLDGWYALAFAAILLGWVFGEEVTRRLFYPLVPLALLHAALALRTVLSRSTLRARGQAFALATAAALQALLCLPAMVQVQEKSFDRAPVLAGFPYSYADITDYYTSHGGEARKHAAGELATLAGLTALASATPPDARVMWMRPEYVALLGHREGVPWYFRWDAKELARQVRATGTTHLVLSRYVKTDLTPTPGDPTPLLGSILEYSRFAMKLPDATDGSDAFLLLEVEPRRLDEYLRVSPAEHQHTPREVVPEEHATRRGDL